MSNDIKNIKYSVIANIQGRKICRLSWLGFDKELPKRVENYKVPLKDLCVETMDFKRPDYIHKAKDILVALIKKKYKHPVSIRPNVGKDEFLIDVD